MIINLENNSNAIKILSTQSRRADLSPVQLKEIHCRQGQLLSYEYVNELEMRPIEINHVQGVREGLNIAPHEFTLILTMMRSGLYVADGFREILDSCSQLEFIHEKTNINELVSKYQLDKMNVVIVDSVINTGQSVKKVIKKLPSCKSLTVVCQVMQADFARSSFAEREDVRFITCRISENFYVGKGKTDTGNRLFGNVPEIQTVRSGNIVQKESHKVSLSS